MEATVVDGNGTETGHIIVTTIGGRNGQPKQVRFSLLGHLYLQFVLVIATKFLALFIDSITSSINVNSMKFQICGPCYL